MRAAGVQSLLSDDSVLFLTCRLLASGGGTIRVFSGFSGDADYAFLDFGPINLCAAPFEWCDGVIERVSMNDDFPYIEEVADALRKIPVLSDSQKKMFDQLAKEIADEMRECMVGKREGIDEIYSGEDYPESKPLRH